MENLSSVVRGLEPKAPNDVFGHNQIQEEAYETLVRDGRCNNDSEARLAHLAVLDAKADILFAQDEDETDSPDRAVDYQLVKEAKRHCFKCPVLNVCTDYSLELKRLDDGVFGGMEGKTRKMIAKKAKVPQLKYPRIRDAHKLSKAG